MNKQNLSQVSPKLLKRSQAQERYNMSWNVLLRVAQDAGAIVRVGRSVYFNSTIMDHYLDSVSGE